MSKNRFDAVRELVKDPSLKVTEIAWKTGYNKGHVSRLRKEAIRQALETEQEPVAWQPIESAPKTGRKVILFYKNRLHVGRTVIARWLTDEQATEIDGDGVGLEGGWYECIDNWDDYTEVAIHEGEPSHWMPLPAPPIEALRQALETKQKTAVSPDGGTGFIDGVWHGPKAWQCQCGKAYTVTCISNKPPKREWVGLTDDAVFELADKNLYEGGKNFGVLAFSKAIEQALKEKNT